jgi:O-antigen/teichoic acid export membrane protein
VEINKNNVGRGAAYLYIEAISLMFSGYIYWLILSKIATSSDIGLSSTVISLALIFMTTASFGIPIGIQRYIAQHLVSNNVENMKVMLRSSLLIMTVGIVVSSLIMYQFADSLYGNFKINIGITYLSILIMSISTVSGLVRAIIVPSLETKIITTSSIISTIVKISLTIVLIFSGFGVLGILIGYLSYPVTSLAMLLPSIKRSIGINKYQLFIINLSKWISFDVAKLVIRSSISFWIPNVINIIGSQLGTVSVFVSNGANDAGIYFIAFSVVTGITLVLTVFSTIAYPALSAMTDARKRAVWRIIKLSLIITLPLSNILLFYGGDILNLFGKNYTEGFFILIILLLSVIPTSLIVGVTALSYSYNNNRQVLMLGLSTSLPRTALYPILVPFFHGEGAALSFVVGSMAGCLIALYYSNKMGLKISWKSICLIAVIPVIIVIPFKIIELNYIISIIIALIISYIGLYRFKILDKEDVGDIARILPPSVTSVAQSIVSRFTHKT